MHFFAPTLKRRIVPVVIGENAFFAPTLKGENAFEYEIDSVFNKSKSTKCLGVSL